MDGQQELRRQTSGRELSERNSPAAATTLRRPSPVFFFNSGDEAVAVIQASLKAPPASTGSPPDDPQVMLIRQLAQPQQEQLVDPQTQLLLSMIDEPFVLGSREPLFAIREEIDLMKSRTELDALAAQCEKKSERIDAIYRKLCDPADQAKKMELRHQVEQDRNAVADTEEKNERILRTLLEGVMKLEDSVKSTAGSSALKPMSDAEKAAADLFLNGSPDDPFDMRAKRRKRAMKLAQDRLKALVTATKTVAASGAKKPDKAEETRAFFDDTTSALQGIVGSLVHVVTTTPMGSPISPMYSPIAPPQEAHVAPEPFEDDDDDDAVIPLSTPVAPADDAANGAMEQDKEEGEVVSIGVRPINYTPPQPDVLLQASEAPGNPILQHVEHDDDGDHRAPLDVTLTPASASAAPTAPPTVIRKTTSPSPAKEVVVQQNPVPTPVLAEKRQQKVEEVSPPLPPLRPSVVQAKPPVSQSSLPQSAQPQPANTDSSLSPARLPPAPVTAAPSTSSSTFPPAGGAQLKNKKGPKGNTARSYPAGEKIQDAAKLRERATHLVRYAHGMLENAKLEYRMRLEAEAAEQHRLAARSMEQVLMDAVENRVSPLLPYITAEELEGVKGRFQEAMDRATMLNKLAAALEQRVKDNEQIIAKTRKPLVDEIKELEAATRRMVLATYTARINRRALVRKYWAWRRNVQLGDTKVGATFSEELARGPPFKHVAIQSDVSHDQRDYQISWLQRLLAMEGTLRRHSQKIRNAVEELEEVNHLIEACIVCPVCSEHFTEAVQFWPCGHVYCLHCFDELRVGPSVYRCVYCGSMSVEGYINSILVNEIVARWDFKDSGYSDVMLALQRAIDQMAKLNSTSLERKLQRLKRAVATST